MQMTDGDKLFVCAELFRVLDLIRKPVLWQLFPKAPSLDQFWKFILWKFVTDMEQKLPFHQSQIQWTHLTLSYPTNCSKTFKDQKKWILWRRKRNLEHQGNLCWPSQLSASKSIPERTENHFYEWEKWKVIHAHSSDEEYLEVAASKMVTTMLRDYDQDERQTDGSRHWDTIRRVLLKAFAQGARDFDEAFWFHIIHEGSNRKRLEYCKDNHGSLCYWLVIQGTL